MIHFYNPQQGQSAKDASFDGRTGVRKTDRCCPALFQLLRSAALIGVLFLVASAALAQSRTVTGKVTSKLDGGGIPGANVLVKGTTTGAITDANGGYSVSVPGNEATLVFSFIGYATQEVLVGERTTLDVQLADVENSLDEVVVIGYGTQAKSDLTGSVGSVKAAQLQERPAASLN